jgi:LmbE family N-acetylglucosaminyl deacetylase
MNDQSSILICFAHPDDEVFGTGGVIAHYAGKGVAVHLICATRGEVGQIADPSLATPETLGQVREKELRCSARTLGISEVILLGYRDSGMAGDPTNADPRAFINAPAEEVVARLTAIIRRLRPQAVITFDPKGGYGHPDHIAIHRHTVAAFHAARDPNRYPKAGPPFDARRLFYRAMSRSMVETIRSQMEALGIQPAIVSRTENEGMVWPDEAITVSMDVSHAVETKWQALHCHGTQFGPHHPWRRAPAEAVKRLLGRETFVLAWPDPENGTMLPELL